MHAIYFQGVSQPMNLSDKIVITGAWYNDKGLSLVVLPYFLQQCILETLQASIAVRIDVLMILILLSHLVYCLEMSYFLVLNIPYLQ